MNLSDLLHCPDCQGRLSTASALELCCSVCDRTIALVDGIADFVGDWLPPLNGTDRYGGEIREGSLASDLPRRIKHAAGGRWPSSLGDVIEFGCGLGLMTETVVTGEAIRSLLVVDTDMAMLQACRVRIGETPIDRPISFAALGGTMPIRDTVADTVIGTTMLSGITDTRAFLTMVHRMLRTGGRALFVVPNRRYFQVVCQGLADALAQRYAREEAWPEGSLPALTLLEETRRLLVHRGDAGLLASLEKRHLFDRDELEDLGQQIGFATADVLPLDPDPAGGQTFTNLCQDAGATEAFAREFGPLAATIGRPYLSLLNHQDASAYSLLWLTKAHGPAVRIYGDRPVGPPMVYAGPDAAVGGVMPRWSVELLGRDTPDGVVVTVGGWCLSNIDTLWVRVTLDMISQQTPVWRHRPDVHEVLNRGRIYHAMNALCSGLDDTLLFPGVHPWDGGCALRVEIILTGGLVVTGPAPERLLMNEPMVVAH
jgi:SAM-dependent methyltransferase